LSVTTANMGDKGENKSASQQEEQTFDWLQLKRELDTDAIGRPMPDQVNAKEKFMFKFRENPLVPVGKRPSTPY